MNHWMPGLQALAEDTRLQIVMLLLRHNYCVRALARHLDLTESAVSQHLKVLREAGLLMGEKRGYYMHYTVDRDRLRLIAEQLTGLAQIEPARCNPSDRICKRKKRMRNEQR